ncbi:hypothetical protein AGMMS49940_13280 [Spirochaetia bacterium]|nr:hypothetical protein AGMMS49940_13280 [Spirochaetia bacterium]
MSLLKCTFNRPVKTIIGFLMMLAATAALYAQAEPYANVKVWVAPMKGGTAEDRAYFDFNLPEEVKGSGYELVDTRGESDFYITCTLDYDTEHEDTIITAELYETSADALIITTSMGYQTTDEMNDWNLTMIYRLMANAPISKSLSMEESEFIEVESENKKVFPHYRLLVGLRGGYSLRIYPKPTSSYYNNGWGNSFEAAVHVSYDPWQYFGFQTEIIFTMDSAKLTRPGDLIVAQNLPNITEKYNSFSLMIPLMVKGIFRFNRLVVSPFVGPYFTMPLGKMTINDDKKSAFSVKVPLGVTAGAELGMHLGPGILFLDTRYAVDFGSTVLANETTVYQRNIVSFSLGYKFGLFKKHPPPVDDDQATP